MANSMQVEVAGKPVEVYVHTAKTGNNSVLIRRFIPEELADCAKATAVGEKDFRLCLALAGAVIPEALVKAIGQMTALAEALNKAAKTK